MKLNDIKKDIMANLPKIICTEGQCCSGNNGSRCQINKLLLEYFVQAELVRMVPQSHSLVEIDLP